MDVKHSQPAPRTVVTPSPVHALLGTVETSLTSIPTAALQGQVTVTLLPTSELSSSSPCSGLTLLFWSSLSSQQLSCRPFSPWPLSLAHRPFLTTPACHTHVSPPSGDCVPNSQHCPLPVSQTTGNGWVFWAISPSRLLTP